MSRVAIIGGGKMGEALFIGFQAAGYDGFLCELDDSRREYLRATHGDAAVASAVSVAAADVIVVATKPAAVPGVLQELVIAPPQLVLSIAAGVTTATIAANVPIGTDIVRVMPNTPALVNEGMSVLSAHEGCSAAGLRVAQQLMSCVGKVAVVPESQQDAVTALSGSGPAYFFLVVEAMTDAGVELGLEPAIAAELAGQTAVGAAAMLRAGTADAPTLRANVTSPGGTTAAAVAELTGRGLPAAILAAMRAARDRSAELGK